MVTQGVSNRPRRDGDPILIAHISSSNSMYASVTTFSSAIDRFIINLAAFSMSLSLISAP
jgi:hypothetical protein